MAGHRRRTTRRPQANCEAFAAEIKKEGFSDILLLGMGGSSLCPEVLSLTFGQVPGFPRLHILDSTDPAQIRSTEKQIDLAKTLFIVSSKSGSTLEPNIYKQYFFERVQQTIGTDKAGSRFIAITDPGSKMQQVAERDHFRNIFYGLPSHRRALLGAVQFRHHSRRRHGTRYREVSPAHERNGRSLQACVSGRTKSGSRCSA